MGSTRVVLTADGSLYDWNEYEPFGTILRSGGGQLSSDRLSYIGKEKDSESDLGDFGVRKYEAETGRFLSVDPLWEKYRKLTPYHYCGNNPLIHRDPTGLDYNVVMGDNTITVSMIIVVANDDDSKNSAELGKQLWESNNGKYEFVTTINGEEKHFDVIFKITLVTEIPENRNVLGGVNTFDVRDDNDRSVFNTRTDPTGTRAGVSYYNHATEFQEAHVKKSHRNSKSTAGHEMGHLFGLRDRETGLMVDDKSKVTSNLNITAGLVNSIINNASPGGLPETQNCKSFSSPNMQSGQVREKE
ncbi:MAG: RHS repeat domain-containing protein [Candidatus Kapaibacterium sp.]